jgi:hypothetical protein
MAIPVTIETKDFKTKTEAMRHFTEMLARHGNRDEITGEDLDDLLNLIKNHPRYNEKVGSGIRQIYADWVQHGARCFWIERTDGTKEDFSIRKCINGAS